MARNGDYGLGRTRHPGVAAYAGFGLGIPGWLLMPGFALYIILGLFLKHRG